MKLYVFQVMRLRNKAAVTSILVLILLVAGGGIYVRASSENAMPHNLKTIPESAVQTISAESMIMRNLSGSYSCDMAYAILDLVNQQRTEAGLSGLFWDATLAASAKIRAAEVPVKWSHTRPDGSAWYTAGSQTQNGENLAAGELTAQQTVTDWMNSPNHAENVLRSCFNSMGVACYFCNGVYYWVILFS